MKSNADLKVMVRAVYDLQKLRIQQGNRIVANFKAKLGQAPSMPEDDLDEVTKALLLRLRTDNKLITTGAIEELEFDEEAQTAEEKKEKKIAGIVSKILDAEYKKFVSGDEEVLVKASKFKGNAVISNYTEMCLIKQYKEIEQQEKTQFKRLGYALAEFPIYTQYLEKVRGIGPAMAGVLLSELDVSKADYASSFHKYAGLDVADDGKGRSKIAAHLIKVAYKDRDGKDQEKNSITFNPFLKTKILGVLGPSFLRAASPYAALYTEYKNRLVNHPIHSQKSPMHRHRMAMRRMVKIFLQDFWSEWRTIEGLSVSAPYHVEKLGLSDHGLEDTLIAKYGTGFTRPPVNGVNGEARC
jgi:hypothetical protein